MLDGDQPVATYHVSNRFLRMTLVELYDSSSSRTFQLRQKRIWSGRLVLLEDDSIVVDYTPSLSGSEYRIAASADTPQPVLLLSIWIATVALVFVA